MPPQPANPTPVNDRDSMLSRKFGREIANYFSGSPVNRVGFLRGDHVFLSQALKHPSTSFLLCRDLQPLVHHSAKDKLAYVKYDDVKPIIGEDVYQRSEDELVKQYDSGSYIPQMIFLGIDEKNPGGLGYQGKNFYKGAPYFAVDVTPKNEGIQEKAEELIGKVGERGYEFAKGRVMELVAADGTYTLLAKILVCEQIIPSPLPPAHEKLAKVQTSG
jgi:NAD+ diphosphatase